MKESFAMEILHDYKLANRRMFIIIIVLIVALICSVGYNIYLSNDIGTIDESITQQNDKGDNNYIGNDGDINGNPNS